MWGAPPAGVGCHQNDLADQNLYGFFNKCAHGHQTLGRARTHRLTWSRVPPSALGGARAPHPRREAARAPRPAFQPGTLQASTCLRRRVPAAPCPRAGASPRPARASRALWLAQTPHPKSDPARAPRLTWLRGRLVGHSSQNPPESAHAHEGMAQQDPSPRAGASSQSARASLHVPRGRLGRPARAHEGMDGPAGPKSPRGRLARLGRGGRLTRPRGRPGLLGSARAGASPSSHAHETDTPARAPRAAHPAALARWAPGSRLRRAAQARLQPSWPAATPPATRNLGE